MRKFILGMVLFTFLNEVLAYFNLFWTPAFFIFLFTISVLLLWMPFKVIKKFIIT